MLKEKTMIVSIPEDTSLKVERLFYEYTGGRETVKFLMKDREVNWEVLQNYVNVVEARYTELEMLKKAVSGKYLPDELRGSDLNYGFEFLFDEHAIRYTLTEN